MPDEPNNATENAEQPKPARKSRCRAEMCIDRRFALLIFLFFLCFYGITNRGQICSWDAVMRLGMAETLVAEQRVGYPPNYKYGNSPIWGIGHAITLIPVVVAAKAIHGISVDVVSEDKALKLKETIREVGTTLSTTALGATTCALLAIFGLQLGYSRRTTLLGVLAFGIATTWWPYTQDGHYEVLQGFCILLALYAMVRHMDGHGWWWASISGAAAGFAFLTKMPNLAILLPLGLYVVIFDSRKNADFNISSFAKTLAYFLPPILICAAIQIWADWSWTGQLFPDQLTKDPAYRTTLMNFSIFKGIGQLFVGKLRGLIWYAPVCVVALFWLPRLEKRKPGLGWSMAATVLVWIMISGKTAPLMTVAWGPRFLISIFPLIALGFFEWFEAMAQTPKRILRAATILIAGISTIVQILATSVDFTRWAIYYNPATPAVKANIISSYPLLHRPIEIYEILSRTPDASIPAGIPMNTLNYWWALAPHAGVPTASIVLMIVLLIAGAFVCLSKAWRITKPQN